ncbi:hypothetical protein KI387_028575, partial [Taxus chinensis]
KDRILELLDEIGLETHFDEEESEETHLEHACEENEKGNMVYVIDVEEMKSLDVNHSEFTREFKDSTDERVSAYHKTLKTKKVNIGYEAEPKEAMHLGLK